MSGFSIDPFGIRSWINTISKYLQILEINESSAMSNYPLFVFMGVNCKMEHFTKMCYASCNTSHINVQTSSTKVMAN